MKKVSISIVLSLLMAFMISSTCLAGSWKTISVNTTTKSYTIGPFQSDGNCLIDLVVHQSYTGNFGTLEIQRRLGNEWLTVSTNTQSLRVGVYTHFGSNITNTGNLRIVFTSNKPVSLSGSVQHFIQ